ncbi:MAG: tRNA lysidine(34) synthetase TilS [Chloroflexia bacterium]|nr:tRNA lysidine(34) synthetase TilS [Chloroflexia bacterium]
MPAVQRRPGEVGIVQRLRASLAKLDLGERPLVLCGYSGGADSLALLGALAELDRLGLCGVHAVHVDHGARPGSGNDARRAAAGADRFGVPFTLIRLPVSVLAGDKGKGLGIEETLRRARYLAFRGAFEQTGAQALALGHHERDQAETVLLHLLRGSGIRGASGMRAFVRNDIPWWEPAPGDHGLDPISVPIWRPFLSESAPDVRAFAESLDVPIVEDPSNRDPVFRRNAIRHDVLPRMEAIAPGAEASLARFARLAGEDSDELERQAREELAAAGNPGALDRAWLLERSVAIQRRVVRHWFERSAIGVELSANRVEQILLVARTGGGAREIEVGSGWSVRVNRVSLIMTGPNDVRHS